MRRTGGGRSGEFAATGVCKIFGAEVVGEKTNEGLGVE